MNNIQYIIVAITLFFLAYYRKSPKPVHALVVYIGGVLLPLTLLDRVVETILVSRIARVNLNN